MPIRYSIYILSLLSLFLCACGDGEPQTDENQPKKFRPEPKQYALSEPIHNSRYTLGDTINIGLDTQEAGLPDSVRLMINNDYHSTINSAPYTFQWGSAGVKVGHQQLRVEAYYNGESEVHNARVILLSDVQPEILGFTIIASYPHDAQAYTQGLTFENGYLYEGTGQKGESSLRRVNLEDGQVMQQKRLPSEFFGEGIAIVNERIIQLTWENRTGFVYDKESFELIRRFNYPTEGWGLTYDGERLLMSDGSETLYIYDPEGLNEIDRIQVYDHEGKVEQLNELEYIDGFVYANIYQEDDIVKIDPVTGKVVARVHLGALKEEIRGQRQIDVLNGIAYDTEGDRLFVTGKWWPKLFHIRLESRPQI